MTSTQSTPRSGEPVDEAEGNSAGRAEGKPAGKAADRAEGKTGGKAAGMPADGIEGESADEPGAAPAAGGKPTAARATLYYTLLRLALFVGTFALLAALAWVGVIRRASASPIRCGSSRWPS